ncbi:hypothetical protein GCM10009416_33110 [Craurococcus roseus]|uniref:Uncharacterized protein n=1 Tax=Craurococcus roseus TaxID=77585 RepID=A0ABP3QJ93_9PROT
MAKQAARAEIPPPTAANLAAIHDLHDLGREWTVIRECRLRPADRGSSPTVLIHPGQGIAIVDVAPSETPDAVDAVRARLGLARFEGIFAGHLPVVHLQATPWQVPALQKLLDDAFAAQPPLTLPGGDAWAGVAARALTAENHPAPRNEPQPSGGTAEAGRQWRTRRRRRRRGRVLRKAFVLLLCLAALGGVLAVAMKDAPPLLGASIRAILAPEAVVAPAAPPVRAVENSTPAEAVASPAPSPAPEPAGTMPAPTASAPRARPAPSDGGATAPMPEASSAAPQHPALETPTAAAPPPAAVPPPSWRQAAPPPPAQAGKPPERTSPPPRQQRRQQQQEAAGADPAPAGSTASGPDATSQRCGRVAARIGSGEALGDADMRFFNQACIRW